METKYWDLKEYTKIKDFKQNEHAQAKWNIQMNDNDIEQNQESIEDDIFNVNLNQTRERFEQPNRDIQLEYKSEISNGDQIEANSYYNQTYNQTLEEAADLLRTGQLIAFPTETVYGLGADATDRTAVQAIFKAKGRPQDNPLIVHVASSEQLYTYTVDQPDYLDPLLKAFTPGPLTFVLKDRGLCAVDVTAGLATIAIRIPAHPVARDLIEISQLPLAAPSANISGKPSPTTANHVADDLSGKIAGIVDAGQTGVGLESTVLDCTGPIPIILRPGGITAEMIEKELGISLERATAHLTQAEKPKAPGMKYQHYAPEIPLWLVYGNAEQFNEVIEIESAKGLRIGVLSDHTRTNQVPSVNYYNLGETMEQIGAEIYNGLRHFKANEYDVIICQAFNEQGIGSAVMNRLKKAATKEIISSINL